MNASEFLGFIGDSENKGKTFIKYKDNDAEGYEYLGEWCKTTNEILGRGIKIYKLDDIYISCFEDGRVK
jgi:hypothetical protein